MPEKPIAYDAYETLAKKYAAQIDTKAYNAHYDRPAVLSLLPEVSGLQVLDAGCGPGAYAQWLVEQGATVTGVDASPQMVDFARQRVGPKGNFYQADLNQPLNFLADDSFDLIVSALTIHYITDLDRLFTEFARVLRPEGYFVFSTHHPFADLQNAAEGRYLDTVLVTETWNSFAGEPVEVSFYHRPLGAITESLASAGFITERLIEPRPTERFREIDPAGYEKLMARPNFLAMRTRRDKMQPNTSKP